jgi:hypothetical protein
MHILGTNSPLPLKKVKLNDTNSGRATMRKALLIKTYVLFSAALSARRGKRNRPSGGGRMRHSSAEPIIRKLQRTILISRGWREDDTLNNKIFSKALHRLMTAFLLL